MRDLSQPDEQRRAFLRALAIAPLVLAIPGALGVSACAGSEDTKGNSGTSAEPTLACVDDDDPDPTMAETEGPYFTPNSPERSSLLESGVAGTLLTVSGLVLTRGCRPVAGALLDSGKRMTAATTTTRATGFGDTSLPTRVAPFVSRRSCRGSTPAALDTST